MYPIYPELGKVNTRVFTRVFERHTIPDLPLAFSDGKHAEARYEGALASYLAVHHARYNSFSFTTAMLQHRPRVGRRDRYAEVVGYNVQLEHFLS